MKRVTIFSAMGALVILITTGAGTSHAAANWVSTVSINDLTGNAPLQSGQALLAGHAYNFTIQVAVPFTQASSTFEPNLSPALLPSGAQFWYVKTPGYAGYNASRFTGGTRAVDFKQVQGSLILSAVFLIPVNLTLSTANGLTRHFAIDNFSLMTVTVSGGSSVGALTVTLEDQTIQTYLSTYQTKSSLVSSGKIDRTYAPLVASILGEAQTLYQLGLPDQGTALLSTVDPAAFPAPPNYTTMTYLFVGLAVAVLVTIILAVVMVRGRGRRGYASGLVGEVEKELAVLEVTAAKYDRALADRLKSLRDKLGETS